MKMVTASMLDDGARGGEWYILLYRRRHALVQRDRHAAGSPVLLRLDIGRVASMARRQQ